MLGAALDPPPANPTAAATRVLPVGSIEGGAQQRTGGAGRAGARHRPTPPFYMLRSTRSQPKSRLDSGSTLKRTYSNLPATVSLPSTTRRVTFGATGVAGW